MNSPMVATQSEGMLGMKFSAMIEEPVNDQPLLSAELRAVVFQASLALPVDLPGDCLIGTIQQDCDRALLQIVRGFFRLRIANEAIVQHLLE